MINKPSLRALQLDFEPQLQYLREELMRLCRFLNSLSTPPQLDPADFEDALISLAYRLLHLRPLNSDAMESTVELAYHLGAVALLWTVMFESGRLHRNPYTLLAESIRKAVNALIAAGTGETALVLWLLFVGGISVLGFDDMPWLCCRIQCYTAVLDLKTWQSTRELLAQFPWINLIHDKPAQRLWAAVMIQSEIVI
jgi:hypothetical protein